jgi:hypothetical protein
LLRMLLLNLDQVETFLGVRILDIFGCLLWYTLAISIFLI